MKAMNDVRSGRGAGSAGMAARPVRHSTLKPGQQQLLWDTRGVPPGSYTVVLRAPGIQPRSEKLILQP